MRSSIAAGIGHGYGPGHGHGYGYGPGVAHGASCGRDVLPYKHVIKPSC
jgi:hypothetical protein